MSENAALDLRSTCASSPTASGRHYYKALNSNDHKNELPEEGITLWLRLSTRDPQTTTHTDARCMCMCSRGPGVSWHTAQIEQSHKQQRPSSSSTGYTVMCRQQAAVIQPFSCCSAADKALFPSSSSTPTGLQAPGPACQADTTGWTSPVANSTPAAAAHLRQPTTSHAWYYSTLRSSAHTPPRTRTRAPPADCFALLLHF